MNRIALDVVCAACDGTGLYIGMGERNGAAVVCSRCDGSGKAVLTYEPFTERKPTPARVTSVHVARGYMLDGKVGGLPVKQWTPGVTVPADEAYYCPFLYTSQGWCAKPEPDGYSDKPRAPLLAGASISSCKHWASKAECWRLFHDNAPESIRRQTS